MPNFRTVQDAQTWCGQHFPSTSTSTHWMPQMDFLTTVKIAMAVTVLASVYYIGKEGLPDTWAGIKNVYAWIRNLFGGQKAATPATTVSATTPVA